MDLTFMRQGYQNEGLTKEQLSPDPFLQFEAWFKEANEAEPIPNAMSLATVCKSGEPMVRTVLLKWFDENGFVFFTNYKSRKADQITDNPNIAMLFNWVALERQVSINGVAEKVDISESLKYFLSRPRGSQLGSWVSDQRSVLTSRKILEMKLQELKRKFANKTNAFNKSVIINHQEMSRFLFKLIFYVCWTVLTYNKNFMPYSKGFFH